MKPLIEKERKKKRRHMLLHPGPLATVISYKAPGSHSLSSDSPPWSSIFYMQKPSIGKAQHNVRLSTSKINTETS